MHICIGFYNFYYLIRIFTREKKNLSFGLYVLKMQDIYLIHLWTYSTNQQIDSLSFNQKLFF